MSAVIVGLFVGLLVGGVGLVLRLMQGPIEISLLEGELRQAIAASIGTGFTVETGPTHLSWVRGGPRVTIRDLTVRRADGTLVARAPETIVDVDLPTLVSGHVAPSALDVRSATLSLTIDGDGHLVLGGPDPDTADGTPAPILGLLDPELLGRGFIGQPPVEGQSTIARLALGDMRLHLNDSRTSQSRSFEAFDATFARTAQDAYRAVLSVNGRLGSWRVGAEVRAPVEGVRAFAVDVAGISVPDVTGGSAGPFADLRFGGTLSGRVEAGRLAGPLEGMIEVAGTATVEFEETPLVVRPLRLPFNYEPQRRTVEITRAPVAFAEVAGTVTGRIILPDAADPTRVVRFDLAIDELAVDTAGTRVPELQRLALRGAFEHASRTLFIDSAHLDAGERRTASGRGVLSFEAEAGPALKLEGTASDVTTASLKRVWPPFLVPEVREWFFENVVDGFLEHTDFRFDAPAGYLDGRPLRAEMFAATWRARDASVRLAPDLPPVTGMRGSAESTGTSFRLRASDGALSLPAGALSIPTLGFVAENLDREAPEGLLEARVVGPVAALLALGETGGLDLGGAGIDPRALAGSGTADVKVTIPLAPETEKPELRTVVDAQLRDVAGRGIFEGRDLERGTFRVRSDPPTVSVEGTGTVAGLSVRVTARQDIASGRLTIRADAETDDATRARLGFDLAPFVTGPAGVRLLRDGSGANPTRRLEMDLTQARIQFPPAALDKPRGTQATFAATLRWDRRLTALEDIVVQGRGVAGRGRVRFGEDGMPNLVELTDVRLRPDDQFNVRVEREGQRTATRVTGRSIDLRPLLQRMLSDDDDAASPGRFELSARVERALGHNGVAVNDLRFEAVRVGPRLTDFSVTGSLGGGARLSGEVQQDRGRPYMFLSATDGGAVLRFLDLYRNMRGGRLTFTQTMVDPAGRRSDGVVLVENFRVQNERGLARLQGAAPPDSDGRRPTEATNDVAFDRMRASFTRSPGVMQLREGILRNPVYGMTFEGQLNWRRQAVDLKGVFIPAYALNNILARIPIVGAFLGGSNEGLIGLTYAVQGPLSGPTLNINPASAVAPGILRNIFAFPDPAGTVRPPIPEGPRSD